MDAVHVLELAFIVALGTAVFAHHIEAILANATWPRHCGEHICGSFRESRKGCTDSERSRGGHHGKQQPRKEVVCTTCGVRFFGTHRSRFCGKQCAPQRMKGLGAAT